MLNDSAPDNIDVDKMDKTITSEVHPVKCEVKAKRFLDSWGTRQHL